MNAKNKADAAPEFFSPQVTEVRRFYLDLNPPKKTPLIVVCGGCEHCAPDYSIHRASFPYSSIEFVARGRGTVRLGRRKYDLQPGKVFCYAPGMRQDIATDPSDPLVKYFVDFTGTRVRSLWRLGQLSPGQAAQVFLPNEVRAVFDELIRNGLRGTRYSAEICTRLLECLVLKVAESLAPHEGVESQAFITYQKCRRHIEENFARLRTVEEAVRECHVNAAYVCRLFRRFDHQSPYQYLLRLKMNRAAEQLHQSNAMVKQVAEQVGFRDQFHFSRVFKNVFGMSPAAFRRLL
jgi:AraC-like DNA-binding protein/quercetin dioxygenase-like cupin family protein